MVERFAGDAGFFIQDSTMSLKGKSCNLWTNTPFVNTSVNFQQKTTLLSSDIKNLEKKRKNFFFN